MAAPWKKNILRIPPAIAGAVTALKRDDCQAACLRRITADQLRSGLFSHLEMGFEDKPSFPERILPIPTVGRYSARNVNGWEKKLTDEPMVSKTWWITTPNFGDWSLGNHDVPVSREVYRREEFSPPFIPIEIDCIGSDISGDTFTFRFKVARILNRTRKGFEDELLFDLNLLQENVGNHGVAEAHMTSEEFLRSLYVNWEILPPGERDGNISRILTGVRISDPAVRRKLIERYDLLNELKPQHFIKGTSGFARYFGAQFSDDLVVFENVEYGNAAYVMLENWTELSQRSRTELLGSDENFIRVVHGGQWKDRLRAEIRNRRPRRRR